MFSSDGETCSVFVVVDSTRILHSNNDQPKQTIFYYFFDIRKLASLYFATSKVTLPKGNAWIIRFTSISTIELYVPLIYTFP